ncbi:VOC family protein [Flavobacterium algicola]|uniref:VOC family protein n=1 Tax=Flavobacterium algicola TaxID=556529 RepID=UPI001EFD0946|nr:VOC family protein [Flavobacterium algicola]MCG9793290.1 VOC family protein [Flavobacterium algicola]
MDPKHIYPGAHSLNAYIIVKGCSDAIEFYKKVFGAVEKFRLLMPDGAIAHAEIEIEGSLLMLSDENVEWGALSPTTIGGSSTTLSIYVKDADKVFNTAICQGATAVMPVKNEFYGDRVGQILDPFGYKWMIATHVESVSPEEMQIRMDKMFAGESETTD